MAKARYDRSHVGSCYINIAEDGGVEAGMILENGEVLIVRLSIGENRAESTRKIIGRDRTHKIVLEREGDRIIRRCSFFGIEDLVEEFDTAVPRGRDYWGGGARRY